MAKFEWQNGTLVSKAKVEIDGNIYEVEPEQYTGTTPLTAENLNQMQDGIYEDIDKKTSKYNIETNGSEVKTGRKIDGKDEYVKRYEITINSVSENKTKAQGKASLGFTLADVTVTEFSAYIISNTNNIFNIDTNNYNAGYDLGSNYISISASENSIIINCNSANYRNKAVVMIYYVKNK